MRNFKDFYEKAMAILDSLNELIQDIEWFVGSEECENEQEQHMCTCLQWAIEDVEAELSDSLYDTELDRVYTEECEYENQSL